MKMKSREKITRTLPKKILKALYRSPESNQDQVQPIDPMEISRVLISRPNHRLGNLLLLTPLIRDLQEQIPGAEVDVLIGDSINSHIMAGFANVGQVYSLPRHAMRNPFSYMRVIRELKARRYDLVIDPSRESSTSRVMAMLTPGRYKLGFTGGKGFGRLTHEFDRRDAPDHFARFPVWLLRKGLKRPTSPHHFPGIEYALTEQDKIAGRRMFEDFVSAHGLSGKPKLGMVAHATGSKDFPALWWSKLCQQLSSQYDIIEILPISSTSHLGKCYPCYYSTSIPKLSSFLRQLDMVIAADGGLMHLACASSVPTIGLFSTTLAECYKPLGGPISHIQADNKSPTDVAEIILRVTPQLEQPFDRVNNDPLNGAATLRTSVVSH